TRTGHPMTLAYSYLRFSSPEQEKGDSVRRQTQLREDWLKHHPDVTLDQSLALTDRGKSGYSRDEESFASYALGQFVEHVRTGRVPKGSSLLVENLDRLSREDVGTATERLLGIVNRAVVVVQLSPVEKEFRKPVNMPDLMFAIMELSRGNSESEMKSVRVGAAWADKRQSAVERKTQPHKRQSTVGGTMLLTHNLPGWIREENGKLVLNEHATTVRRIFALAIEGYGAIRIAAMLNKETVPVMSRSVFKGKKVVWNSTVVHHLLTSRAAFGEYQPHQGTHRSRNRKPVGDPIPDYYPAAVDANTFHAAQASLQSRSKRGAGRTGKHLNLLSGLLIDARDGGSLTYYHLKGKVSTVIPVNAKHGKGPTIVSFPAEPLERALRSQLTEIPAREINKTSEASLKVESLSGQLAE